MDAAVHSAITAVWLDDTATQQQWFEVVCQTYDQLAESGQPTWDDFTSSIGQNAGSAGLDSRIAEQFVQQVGYADPAPIETVGRMRELAGQLPELYRELAGDGSGTDASGVDGSGTGSSTGGYDESAWNAFLVEHGTRWDGEDGSWEQFKAWFLYEAEQRGLAEPARGFVEYVQSQPDKAAVFAAYGVTVGAPANQGGDQPAAPDVSGFPELKLGDSGEWVEYLDAMLSRNGF